MLGGRRMIWAERFKGSRGKIEQGNRSTGGTGRMEGAKGGKAQKWGGCRGGHHRR